jgi:ATPase subunit of ABC transporter with duplicated ATPase domains
VSRDLVPGSRIGLLGRNGAGKSTLIKLLAGELEAMEGKTKSAEVVTQLLLQHVWCDARQMLYRRLISP